MKNTDLDHIALLESNASFGNSGGPVFSLNGNIELVGILVGGYSEVDQVYNNGKPLLDSLTKKPLLYTQGRSGVSIIEKAEYVRKLIALFQKHLDDVFK